MPEFRVVIPARYASTRLPGKLLELLDNRSVLSHVIDKANLSGATEVIVATDSQQSADSIRNESCRVVQTSPGHQSGTDRIAEVVISENWNPDEIVVNVQGDEPLIDPQLIRDIVSSLDKNIDASISTAAHRIDSATELFNPNLVKVVCDHEGSALFFSRAPIPWDRDQFNVTREKLHEEYRAQGHIGIYGYRAAFLRTFQSLQVGQLEAIEKLEQLRALENGFKISVVQVLHKPEAGIDTPEDLDRVRNLIGAI